MSQMIKGYLEDAGVDIILDYDITFKAHSTTVVPLEVEADVLEDTCGMLIERTSAAKQGIIISHCPVDANYTGEIHAIVHNLSGNDITFPAGIAFCQYVVVRIETLRNIPCKKQGKRGDSAFGQTDK